MYTILKFDTREEWLEARKGYVTATDVYNIVRGRKPQKTDKDLAKTSPYVKWGLEREESLAKEIIETFSDDDVFSNLYHSNNELYVRLETDHACSPDIIGDKAIIEIKTTTKDLPVDIEDIKRRFPQYYYQIQWQLFITRRQVGVLFFEKFNLLEDGSVEILETKSFTTHPEETPIAEIMYALRIMVEPLSIRELGTLLYEHGVAIRELTKQKDEAKRQLLALMKKENCLYVEGEHYKVSLVKGGVSKTFDTQRFKKENPSLYAKYIKETETKENLRVIEKKDGQ